MRATWTGLVIIVGGCTMSAPSPSPTEDEVRCASASECVLSTMGCCPTATAIAIRADAEGAFRTRSCPDDPNLLVAECGIAFCPSFLSPYNAVAICEEGQCARLDYGRGSEDAAALRGCGFREECVVHDRCATYGTLDCWMEGGHAVVALARDAVADYEASVGGGCTGTTDDPVDCVHGLCEILPPP